MSRVVVCDRCLDTEPLVITSIGFLTPPFTWKAIDDADLCPGCYKEFTHEFLGGLK